MTDTGAPRDRLAGHLDDLDTGAHLCCMYASEEERAAVLLPFLRHGLEQHQRVLYIADEAISRTALAQLGAAGVAVDERVSRRQLLALTPDEAYLRGGDFDAERMIALLRNQAEEALHDGFAALRVAGEMAWALDGGPPQLERLLQYESRLSEFFADSHCLALCLYDRRLFPAPALLEVLHTHSVVLQGTQWYANPYHIHREAYLSADRSRLVLDNWLDGLGQRRQAEQLLRDSEQQYRSLFHNMEDGFALHRIVLDPAGKPVDYVFLDVNRAFERQTGLRRQDLVGRRVTEVLPGVQADPADWIARYGKVALTGESISFENHSQQLGKWYAVTAYRPAPGQFATLFMDITRRRELEDYLREQEERLRESEERFRGIFEKNPTGIALVDTATQRFIRANDSFLRIVGYSAGELSRLTVEDITHPDDWQSEPPLIRASPMDPTVGQSVEKRYIRTDGETRWVRVTGDLLHSESGGTPIAIAAVEDITERRRMEQELVRIQRLRAVGELAAGVSHNLNNILTGVLMPARLLELKTTDPDLLADIRAISTYGQRARDLVRRLHLSVRGVEEDVLGPVAVNEVVEQAIDTTKPRWRDEAESRGVTIRIDTGLDEVPPIRGTHTRLHDVLTNLVFNAVDAMPQGGTITIRTCLAGQNVRLEFSDTGIGMDEDTRQRVFEPFFTTKQDVGTGLGLSTVYNTIVQWGGVIDVASAPGEGAAFTLLLPVAQEVGAEGVPSGRSQTSRRGRLLVVDDDRGVCQILERSLADHEVVTFQSGQQTLDEFVPGHYDAALIDLGMTGMAGDELARRLRRIDPSLALVLITGWELSASDARRDPFDFLLRKPFSELEELETTVAQALDLHEERMSGA